MISLTNTPNPEVLASFGPNPDIAVIYIGGGKGQRYCAYDRSRFDGAPDASPESRIKGYGDSTDEAIADLMRQYE